MQAHTRTRDRRFPPDRSPGIAAAPAMCIPMATCIAIAISIAIALGMPALGAPEGRADGRTQGPQEEGKGGRTDGRIEPAQPRGVFVEGEGVAFLLTGRGRWDSLTPGGVRILDVDGRDVAAVGGKGADAAAGDEGAESGKFREDGGVRVAIQDSADGARRLSIAGLGRGHWRLLVDPSGSPSGVPSGDGPAVEPIPFAVLPRIPPDLPGTGSALAVDAAISWLVAKPESGSGADVADCLRLARLAGIRMVRERITWQEVERTPGETRWGRYAEVAALAGRNDIAVYQIFHHTPSWAREDRDSKRMPDDLRYVHRFARALQERFRGTIDAWEPWNEPDIAVFSDDPADQLAAYQKAACLGFKAADARSTVLMVSLAHPPGAFVESFLENETGPYFDVYNYHIYDSVGGYARRAAAHAEMAARFGVSDKPLWVTEAGVPLKAPSGDLTHEQGVEQAEFIPKAYAVSLASGVERHFFFILPWYLERGVQFGLLDRKVRPGPGYVALAAMASALGNAAEPRVLEALPAGIAGYLFARGDGREAAVVWAEGERRSLVLPEGAEAQDVYGRGVSAGPDRAVTVTSRAVYVVGGPEGFAAWKPRRCRPSSTASAASRDPARGGAAPSAPGDVGEIGLREVVPRFLFRADRGDKSREAWKVTVEGTLAGKLQVYNFSGTAFRGRVRIAAEPGLAVEPAEAEVSVEADGLATIDVLLRWEPDGADVRKARAVVVRARAEGGRAGGAGQPVGDSAGPGPAGAGDELRSSAAVLRVVR